MGMGRKSNVIVFVVTAIVCLILLEVAAAFMFARSPMTSGKKLVLTAIGSHERFVRVKDGYIIPHPYLLYVNRPGFADSAGVQIDSLGYRGREIAREKPPGTYRVLTLGGSTTMSWPYVEDPSQTWSGQVEAGLSRAFPDRTFEVVNGGLAFATSAELLAGYMFRHRYLHPDLVIIHTGGNDVDPLMFEHYTPEYWGGKGEVFRRDDVAHLAGLGGAAVVDIREQCAGDDGEGLLERDGEAVDVDAEALGQHVAEVGAEAERIEAARDGVCEPRHPAGEESAGLRETLLDPQVASAGVVKARTQLGVGHGGEQGDRAVEEEDENQRRSRDAGRDAGEDEDPGTNHGSDTDQGDGQHGHFARESNLDAGRVIAIGRHSLPPLPSWNRMKIDARAPKRKPILILARPERKGESRAPRTRGTAYAACMGTWYRHAS